MINLKISDINWENDYIRLITTKNRKQQIIPLSRSLKDILQEYLKYRGDISTTRIYVNLADEDLKADYDKFNPLDTFLNRNKKEHINMKKNSK